MVFLWYSPMATACGVGRKELHLHTLDGGFSAQQDRAAISFCI